MSVKGRILYFFYCFYTVIFAVQCYYAYQSGARGEAALYGIASLSSIGLMLYALLTRKPKPPAA